LQPYDVPDTRSGRAAQPAQRIERSANAAACVNLRIGEIARPRSARQPHLWRDNLDEVAATIRMAIWCRGWLMIDALIIRRKVFRD
jgi:hypothetical protein